MIIRVSSGSLFLYHRSIFIFKNVWQIRFEFWTTKNLICLSSAEYTLVTLPNFLRCSASPQSHDSFKCEFTVFKLSKLKLFFLLCLLIKLSNDNATIEKPHHLTFLYGFDIGDPYLHFVRYSQNIAGKAKVSICDVKTTLAYLSHDGASCLFK